MRIDMAFTSFQNFCEAAQLAQPGGFVAGRGRSHDCNSYIIQGEQFLRDFDGMYKACEDPWDHQKNGIDRATETLLERLSGKPFESVLDVGAGLGAQSTGIISTLGLSKSQYVGTDVSVTCVEKACELGWNFVWDDVRKRNDAFCGQFDLIMAIKILYYCAPEIDLTLDNLLAYAKSGGVLSYVYNETPDSFSRRWLTLDALRSKLATHCIPMISETISHGSQLTGIDAWLTQD